MKGYLEEEQMTMKEALENEEWRDKKGRYIPIVDMKTSHLMNVFEYLLRQIGMYERYLLLIRNELNKRGFYYIEGGNENE